MRSSYAKARREVEQPVKLIVRLPKADLNRVDEFGLATGMPSRAHAVRHLIDAALTAMSDDKSTAQS